MCASIRAEPVENVRATAVRFEAEMTFVRLADGREIGVPLEWFPSLTGATPAERANWEIIGQGVGIHWIDLDEDLSVAGLLGH